MAQPWLTAAGLLLAAALDGRFGELPSRWHPVRWMGLCFSYLERHAPRRSWAAFLYGAAIELAFLGLLAALLHGWERWLVQHLPGWLAVAAYAVTIKPAFAVRALVEAGRQVERALQRRELDSARRRLAWHLVSRDTASLSPGQVAGAAIESLAENTNDSIVAPIFYGAIGGLAGAWCYRLVNTLDAMWGYRGPYEYLGKGPARLDDAANWIPARLTALLLLAAGRLRGEDVGRGWRLWRRDAGLTPSPNAGHPMAAAAGLLGVRFEKVGFYTLHAEARDPGPHEIARAGRLVETAGWLAVVCAVLVAVAMSFIGPAGLMANG